MESKLNQKQIEEMITAVYPYVAEWHEELRVKAMRNCGAYSLCEKLYNAGYRKISENAVVVPDMAGKDFYAVEKAEWDKMVQGAKDIIRATRKETAEEFAERLKVKLKELEWGSWVEVEAKHFNEIFDEIAKEIIGDTNAKNE